MDDEMEVIVEDPEAQTSNRGPSTTPLRRGRGRPRVSRVVDSNTIEKRRAQVRNAQRTYQKRKDNVVASTNQRCDELLQVISDISSDLEDLLQAAHRSGDLKREDELGGALRRVSSAYDTAINNPSLGPELRILKNKHNRRQEEWRAAEKEAQVSHPAPQPNVPTDTLAPTSAAEDLETPSREELPWPSSIVSVDSGRIDLDLSIVQGTTLIQTFNHRPGRTSLGGRTMIGLVQERQAELNWQNWMNSVQRQYRHNVNTITASISAEGNIDTDRE